MLFRSRAGQVGTGDRSEKIRTYNFPQDRCTDHRIGLTVHNLDKIMDGNLDEIIDALATHELYQYLQKTYGETNPEVFEPKDLIYKTKRQTPATKIQKIHLKELADYHKIELDIVWEQLTRSEASRLMDKLISQYGRCPKD